jgi:transposase
MRRRRSSRKSRARIENGSLTGRDKIGVRVGKVVNKYKVSKHFALTIEDTGLEFKRLKSRIAAEAALDGLHVIRTNVPRKQMTSADTVRSYKEPAKVERAFRPMKTIDLHIRPIHHRLEGRVRAHIFLCMLAYYVEWHMREAWRELMFADEDLEHKKHRDPVVAAERSEAALNKVATRRLKDSSPLHSFRTLLDELSTIVRNTCEPRLAHKAGTNFQMTTMPNPAQNRALQVLQSITE